MKKRKHSLLIIVLAAAIALSSAACAGEAGNGAESTITVPGNGKWVDSSIRGTITAESEPRLQDDFAAAANKEYLLELAASTDEDTAAGSFELMDQEINQQCAELFDDAVEAVAVEVDAVLVDVREGIIEFDVDDVEIGDADEADKIGVRVGQRHVA